jgi:hypothetical protein
VQNVAKGNKIASGVIWRPNFEGQNYTLYIFWRESTIFSKILLKKIYLKRDKKGDKLFFYRSIAPKCPAVITPLKIAKTGLKNVFFIH